MSRTTAIGNLRTWGRHEVLRGRPVNTVYHALQGAMDNVVREFLTEHEMAGVRYWHTPENNSYFLTAPGDPMGLMVDDQGLAIELTRAEFLSRQGLHFPYLENEL